MIKYIRVLILLISPLFIYQNLVLAQGIIHISGKINGEDKQYSDIKIFILKDSNIVDVQKVVRNDTFSIQVPAHSNYAIKFTKQFHIQQIINIVVETDLNKDTIYIVKDLTIQLFKPFDGVSTIDFNQAVGEVYLKSEENKFKINLFPIIEQTYKEIKNKKSLASYYENKFRPIYEEKLGEATKEMTLGNFEKAKSLLRDAKSLFPKETKPDDILRSLDRSKRSIQEKERQDKTNMYRTIITKADSEFKIQNYEQAKNFYVQAQSIKPQEEYPSYMMKRIEEFIGIRETKDMDVLKIAAYYDQTLKKADSLLDLKKYQDAKQMYQKAIRLNRNETQAKSKLLFITSIIGAENKQLSDSLNKFKKYKQMVMLADNAFKVGSFEDAISMYKNCISLNNEETYPGEQIKKIQELQIKKQTDFELNNEIEVKYKQLLKDADFYLSYQKYDDAENLYNEILKIKPTDKLVVQKINEIKAKKANLLELTHNLKRNDEQYEELLKTADNYLKFEKYKDAIQYYQKANLLKPVEPYAQIQIIKINEIIKKQEIVLRIETCYKNAILVADKAMERKEYYDAKNLYRDALFYKDNDTYAKEKITELNKLIIENDKLNKENNDKQIAFVNAMNKGENNLKSNKYIEAQKAFEQAIELGINTKYANDKIAEAKMLMINEQLKLEELNKKEEKYKLILQNADEAYKVQSYIKAKEYYTRALDMKYYEPYPREKIIEIDRIINLKLQTELDQKSKEIAFSEAIHCGDSTLKQNRPFEALQFYKRAISLKRSDEETLKKIQKTELALIDDRKNEDEERKKEKEFNNLIFQGENLILVLNYEEAIHLFEEALKLKPKSSLPKEKINETRDLIERKIKQKQDEVNDFLILAEKAMVENDFRVARYYFELILSNNKNNIEATNKLKELNKLAELNKKENKVKAYANLIEEANKAFKIEELNVAEYYFRKALELNPDDQSPVEMLEKIKTRKITLRQKTIDDTYTDYITSGNKAIETKDYGAAIAYFSKAKDLKPLEQYPDQKIIEVKHLISR